MVIITENPRAAKAIAKAFNATPGKISGIFNNDDLTVISVPQDFLTPRKLNINNLGKLPYIPPTYSLRQDRRKCHRGFESTVRKTILAANEVVFASESGADAQARFDNLCRHFNVGQKTSRMWLNSLRSSDIVSAFASRESGRKLHRLAQAGLVSMAMESAFNYNFNNALHLRGFTDVNLSLREVMVLDFLRTIDELIDQSFRSAPTFRLCLNPGTGMGMMSKQTWNTKDEAEAVLRTLTFPAMLPVEMDITIDKGKRPELFCTTTLQIEAFRSLHLLPSRTMTAARNLFNRGIITSPYTHKSSITTIANPVENMSRSENSLYQLIRDRKNAVNRPNSVTSGKISYSIGGIDFSHTLSTSKVQNLPIGNSLCGEPFIEAVVREIAPSPTVTYELTTGLSALMKGFTDEAIPFRVKDDDFGCVISSLIGKKLVNECEGMIFLSDTAEDIMDYVGRLYPGANLIAFRSGADRLAKGIGSGKRCITDFGKWLYSFTSEMLNGKILDGNYSDVVCPVCGANAIYHAKHNIRCAECNYRISDSYLGRKISPEITRQLLNYFYTSEIKGLKTEKGKRFSSVLALDANYQPTHVNGPDVESYRPAV